MKYENQVHTLRLPPVENMVGLDTYLELLREDLGCCDNLISTTAANVTCSKCNGNQSSEQLFKQDLLPDSKRQSNFKFL